MASFQFITFQIAFQFLQQTNVKQGVSGAPPSPMSALTFRPQQVPRSLASPRTRPQPSPYRAPMPSRLRSALPRSLSRPLDSAGVFYCPSCSTWRRALLTRAGASNTGIDKINSAHRSSRFLESPTAVAARSFTTSSVITAGKTVPPRFKELYDALSGVQDAAIQEVSISRLQLALRGLESEAPLIRVAGELCPAQWLSVRCCDIVF